MHVPSFQTIFLSAPDAVIVIDEKGMVINWNSKAEMMFGWKAQEVIGKSLAETIIPEQYRERHREGIKHYLDTGIGPVLNKTIEIEARRRDGSEFDVSLSISASRLEEKQIFIGFMRDITLHKKLESQLRVLNRDLYLLVEEKTAEIKKSEEELQQSYDAIRELVSYLQDIREEERLHIAQEIHDELGQQLTVMKMDVSWLNNKLGELNPQLRERTEGLKTMLDKTVKTVRRIASELRPSILDDMGLAVAIEWHINELQKRTGLRIDFEKSKEELQLPEAIKIGLYRITQEALTNVVRYARAKTVKIKLYQQANQLHLHIGDDGTGFDPTGLAVKKTLGILGMKERASKLGGNLQVTSRPGNGTTITVMIPLPQEPIPFSPKLP